MLWGMWNIYIEGDFYAPKIQVIHITVIKVYCNTVLINKRIKEKTYKIGVWRTIKKLRK